MKQLPYVLFLLMLMACQQTETNTNKMDKFPIYNGDDLGVTKTSKGYQFKTWAPTASQVNLHFYDVDVQGDRTETIPMEKADNGVWMLEIPASQNGKYFTLQATVDGKELAECLDPYAKVVGRNGVRQMVAVPEAATVDGWESDTYVPLESQTDAIVYELHIRDMTIEGSNVDHPGKYMGLIQKGTKANGVSTAIDHILEMGVTHVHLLPTFDHRSIDETKLDSAQYNWGYDPLNYNAPEGSFSMDPANGLKRVEEFKKMVKTFHDNGIGVILDVVYNHTGLTADSYFEQLVPGYYYRQNESGGFSDASACGNETASERAMVRKFILESVAYWTKEYHLDGFRFDLMGIHDIETMNAVAKTVRSINPNALIYGEGWTAGDSPLPEPDRALKKHAYRMDNVAVFSDDIRDALKGYVFDPKERGFVSGLDTLKESIKFGAVAATYHQQVDYDQIIYTDTAYAANPQQTVTYVSCHDNHTLWDRLTISVPGASKADKVDMQKLALASVLTSQGISFLHAGSEFCRTKEGEENSYNKPDAINRMDWERKKEFLPVVDYVKGLIALRKDHPAFRMRSTEEIRKNLTFLDANDPQVVAYQLDGAAMGDSFNKIIVILNGKSEAFEIELPAGSWKTVVDKQAVYTKPKTASKMLKVDGVSAWVGYL